VQPYDVRGASYLMTLNAWVDNGARLTDHSLVDMASGIVNRGCHDAPFEGKGGTDPCGNGAIHAGENRRKNFEYIWRVLEPLTAAGVQRTLVSRAAPHAGSLHAGLVGTHSVQLAKAEALEA